MQHRALVRLEIKAQYTLITQNVDGLHDRAGSAAFKLHDTADACTLMGKLAGPARAAAEIPPHCACGGAYTGMVQFGEPPQTA
jgi:NAD-dependent deacetylase